MAASSEKRRIEGGRRGRPRGEEDSDVRVENATSRVFGTPSDSHVTVENAVFTARNNSVCDLWVCRDWSWSLPFRISRLAVVGPRA